MISLTLSLCVLCFVVFAEEVFSVGFSLQSKVLFTAGLSF